jgi:hypothetical protein
LLFHKCTHARTLKKCKTNTIPILRHQMSILSNQVFSVVLRPKKLEKLWKLYKSRNKNNYCAMKLSQIRWTIELCMREIILRFEMNLSKLLFSWQNYSYLYFKQIPKYLATGSLSPAEVSTQGLKCKTNTISILMHQMYISTYKK